MANQIYAHDQVHAANSNAHTKGVSIGEALLFSLAFIAFFPYLRSSPLGSDVQPHYFAIFPAAFFVFHHRLQVTVLGALYLGILLGVGVMLSMSPVELIALSTMYITAFLVSGADERQKHVVCWAVRIAMLIYLAGVLADFAGVGGSLESFVSNRRGHGSRGACSFASEPSFLGFTGLAGFVILFKLGNRNWILDSLVPWMVLFGSGSIAAILPAVLVIGSANLRSIRSLAVTGALISVLFISAFTLFPQSRFVVLMKDVYRSPSTIFEVSSGANRFFRGFAPTFYGFKSGLRPHNISELEEVFREADFLRDDVRITRVSNLAGQLFFFYGAFSLPVIALYAYQLRSAPPSAILFAFVTTCVFSFSLVTTSTPYLHWLLAALLWPTATSSESNSELSFEN